MRIYKGDKECNCDPSQLEAMVAGGWSKDKPNKKETTEEKTQESKKPEVKPKAAEQAKK